MKFLLLLSTLFLGSCGETNPARYLGEPMGKEDIDGYTPVARAFITISKNDPSFSMILLKSLNPIQNAFAQSQSATVTYTAIENASITVDVAALIPVLSGGGDTLDLGSVTITDLKANKLKVCGPGNNQKCTQAVIRAYTTELVGFEGIEGFVNKTDLYGVPVSFGPTTASESVGLSSANAGILQSYTIPFNDNKLTQSDFADLDYVGAVDFSNAGVGSYEMTLVIELAVAL